MGISSHLGIVLLVIVGALTIFGVIIIAAIESRRMEDAKPPILGRETERPAEKRKD